MFVSLFYFFTFATHLWLLYQ